MVRFLCVVFFFHFNSLLLAEIKLSPVLKPDPPDAGDNRLDLRVADANGKPIDKVNINALIFMPAMGTMPRMDEGVKITPKGDGHYLLEFSLSMGGTWEVILDIAVDNKHEIFNYSITTGVPGMNFKGRQDDTPAVGTTTQLLTIGPERLQRIGVRFVEAANSSLKHLLRAVGIVESDNTRRSEVTLRYGGYVEKQMQGRVGDYVAAGTPLFTVYSPELIAAENEYLLAHGARGGMGNLTKSSLDRLKNFGLLERDIAALKAKGEPDRTRIIRAPASGTILAVNVREGSSFAAGQLLYTIGDLSKNYIVARIFQKDVSDIRAGQDVTIIMPEGDGREAHGKVDLIFPSIVEGEGTANVRVVLAEPTIVLKPGLYVDLRFPIDYGNRLVVPTTAVLYSGLHRYIFVDKGNGNLEPREVQLGKNTEDLTEVTFGIAAGERVVASGAFLISSEAQLRSALPKWQKSANTHH